MQQAVNRLMSREIVQKHSLMMLLGSRDAEECLAVRPVIFICACAASIPKSTEHFGGFASHVCTVAASPSRSRLI
jgi:hypothetical protein